MKFGLPMASALTTLAWGGLSYPAAYQAAGQADHLREAVRWGADYLLKAHVSPEEFYCQVLGITGGNLTLGESPRPRWTCRWGAGPRTTTTRGGPRGWRWPGPPTASPPPGNTHRRL